jgi:hypothetical protein
MFRNILLATVASLSLLAPLAIPTESQAREVHRPFHDFHVYVRGCNREAWRCAGDYRCREDAVHAAHHLRERGLETMIR